MERCKLGSTGFEVAPLDVYQSHCNDENTPFEETLGANDLLLRQGKVRAIGASDMSAQRLRQSLHVSKANGLPRYSSSIRKRCKR